MKVRITLNEEALGSSPSNEELLATYIASKAPTDDLTAEEVNNIKAQNAEDRITVFPKLADGTPLIWDYQIKGIQNKSTRCPPDLRSTRSCTKPTRRMANDLARLRTNRYKPLQRVTQARLP